MPKQKGGVSDAAPGKDDISAVLYKHDSTCANGYLNASKFDKI